VRDEILQLHAQACNRLLLPLVSRLGPKIRQTIARSREKLKITVNDESGEWWMRSVSLANSGFDLSLLAGCHLPVIFRIVENEPIRFHVAGIFLARIDDGIRLSGGAD